MQREVRTEHAAVFCCYLSGMVSGFLIWTGRFVVAESVGRSAYLAFFVGDGGLSLMAMADATDKVVGFLVFQVSRWYFRLI